MFSVGVLAASVLMDTGLGPKVVVMFCNSALEELVKTEAEHLEVPVQYYLRS